MAQISGVAAAARVAPAGGIAGGGGGVAVAGEGVAVVVREVEIVVVRRSTGSTRHY